jgi:hypothetical protein
MVRASINSVIRFAHQISVTRLFMFIAFQRYINNPDAGRGLKRMTSAIAECRRREAKEKLAQVHERMRDEILRHLLVSSPHIVLMTPALVGLDKLLSVQRRSRTDCARPLHAESAILIEAQARESFTTEKALRKLEPVLA